MTMPDPASATEALPPGLLILMDKADDWLEASKLANRDFATAQHGVAADLKRKAFVEFIHASVRENPKTLQTGLSLLRSLSRRLQEAEEMAARLDAILDGTDYLILLPKERHLRELRITPQFIRQVLDAKVLRSAITAHREANDA